MFKVRPASTSTDGAGGPDTSSNVFAISRSSEIASDVVEGTTSFVEDASIPVAEILMPVSIGHSLQSSANTGGVTSIQDWLRRPTIIHSGVLSASDAVGTFPQLSCMSALFASSNMYNKIQGAFGIRATTVYKLQVNGNKFMQGRYMLSHIPCGGTPLSGGAAIIWAKNHSFTLAQRSQLPHVELDLACDTSCVLRVPYVSAYDYYPVNSQNWNTTQLADPGFVQMYPYVPLTAPTGGATPSFTLWAWFEDIELVGAVVPQSGAKFSKKPPTEQEQASAGVGPISSTLSKVSNAASILGEIPLLSSVAYPASWVAGVLSRSASALGWSKPINLEHFSKVQKSIFPYMGNFDAVDNSNPLSLSCKNQVEAAPGFAGTDIDEMAFSSFLTIPTWCGTYDWTTSTAPSANICTFNLAPQNFYTSATDSTTSYTNFTPMGLLSNRFSYWRGGFVFTIKLVKTSFHSGRLTFWFNPAESVLGSVTALTTEGQRYFVQREILDVREANEFTITIPFTSLAPYRTTVDAPTGSMGMMGISVLDALNNPSSVSNTVSVIVEVHATPDFEFAVPRQSNFVPVCNVVPQGNVCFTACTSDVSEIHISQKPTTDVIRPQSGAKFNTESNVCNLTTAMVGTSRFSKNDCSPARICIGEKINSFRSMLKVSSLMAWSTASIDNTVFRNILPFAISATVSSAAPSGSTANLLPDLYSLLGSIFAMSRGGVRLKIIPNAMETTMMRAYSNEVPYGTSGATQPIAFGTTDILGRSTANSMRSVPQVIATTDNTRGIELQIPQYHFLHSRANADQAVGGGVSYLYTYTNHRMAVSVSCTPAPASGTSIWRSGSDDCSFGSFVSIPPVVSILAVY